MKDIDSVFLATRLVSNRARKISKVAEKIKVHKAEGRWWKNKIFTRLLSWNQLRDIRLFAFIFPVEKRKIEKKNEQIKNMKMLQHFTLAIVFLVPYSRNILPLRKQKINISLPNEWQQNTIGMLQVSVCHLSAWYYVTAF